MSDSVAGVDWDVPDDWTELRTIDAHTGGEPFRIVTDGIPALEGETILEKRRCLEQEYDHLRKALMWEPRGHADMYGAVLTEPTAMDADVGVLFMHNDGYSTMCGHGIIALTKVGTETGLVPGTTPQEGLTIETPAGLVTAWPRLENDRVVSVAFENVPSFVYRRDRTVDVPGLGEIGYDIAFGGAFYAYCTTDSLGIEFGSTSVREFAEIGRDIKEAVSTDVDVTHPADEDLSFLYGVVISDRTEPSSAGFRNVCVFADGEIDRSPTGTGVSGHVARRADDGRLAPGESVTVESIVGSTFTGSYEAELSYKGYDAVVPVVQGTAHVTGTNRFVVDPEDPFGTGFFLR